MEMITARKAVMRVRTRNRLRLGAFISTACRNLSFQKAIYGLTESNVGKKVIIFELAGPALGAFAFGDQLLPYACRILKNSYAITNYDYHRSKSVQVTILK